MGQARSALSSCALQCLETSSCHQKVQHSRTNLTNVDVAFHDRLEGGVMDTAGFFADEAGLEKHFWAAETFASNSNDIAIWKLVSLFLVRALTCCLHLRVKVQCDVRQLLFNITDDFTLSCRCERISTFGENLHQVFCQVTTCKVET